MLGFDFDRKMIGTRFDYRFGISEASCRLLGRSIAFLND
jgi:hypothetical protein